MHKYLGSENCYDFTALSLASRVHSVGKFQKGARDEPMKRKRDRNTEVKMNEDTVVE